MAGIQPAVTNTPPMMLPNGGAQPCYEYGQEYAKLVGLEVAQQQALRGEIVQVPKY